jgi:hypothetical protein
MSNELKNRPGAELVPNDATLSAAAPTLWDKVTGSNFLFSILILILGAWTGNSKELATAGAGTLVGLFALLHAGRTYVVTNQLDFKRWLLDTNTWAALLTVVTTFVAIPADLTAALSGVVDAFNGGSLPAIVSALFYFVNIVLRLFRGNGSQTPAVVVTVAVIMCATLATLPAGARYGSVTVEYCIEKQEAIVAEIMPTKKGVVWHNC